LLPRSVERPVHNMHNIRVSRRATQSSTDAIEELRRENARIIDVVLHRGGASSISDRDAGASTPHRMDHGRRWKETIAHRPASAVPSVGNAATPNTTPDSIPPDLTRFLSDVLSGPEEAVVEVIISRALERLTRPRVRGVIQSCGAMHICKGYPDDARVSTAIEYIRDHFNNPLLRLQEVSSCVHLSKWYLVKLMKACLGTGFRDTVRTFRIYKALELLAVTTLEIKEIAAATGYRHASELTRDFKRTLGVCPTTLRRGRSSDTNAYLKVTRR
jgi:AraC-like DNA-binding protein